MRPHLRFLAAGLAALVPMPASSALPPQYQRAAELKAVVADPKVANAFGGTPIDRVEFVRTDLYRVGAGRCRLDVVIVDLPTPPGVAGPRRFAVRVGTKVCGR